MGDYKSKKGYEIRGEDFFNIMKMILFSLFGIIMFLFPLYIENQIVSPIEYIYQYIYLKQENFIYLYISVFISIFTLKDFYNREKTIPQNINIIIKIISLLVILLLFSRNEFVLFKNDKLVYIMKETIFKISVLLPLGSLFLPFILEYGVLNIIDGYFQKPMKKIFKSSGKSVLAFIVFVFIDNFIGYYMVYKLFKEGKLRKRECENILLNFSVAEISILYYISSVLELDFKFILIIEIFILIITNTIICRIYPIKKQENTFLIKSDYKEKSYKKNKFKMCIITYLQTKEKKNIFKYIFEYFNESINIVTNILPMIIISFFIMDLMLRNEIIISFFINIYKSFLDYIRIPNSYHISRYTIIGLFNQTYSISILKNNLMLVSKVMISVIIVSQCISFTSSLIFIRIYMKFITYKDILLVYIERVFIMTMIIFLLYYFYIGFTG